jgi:hypothetical protein
MAHRPSDAFLEFIFSCLLSLSSLAVSAAVDAHGHAFHAQGRSRGAPLEREQHEAPLLAFLGFKITNREYLIGCKV